MPPDCLPPQFDSGPGVDDAARLDDAARAFAAGDMAVAARLCHAVLATAPGHLGALRRLGLVHLLTGDPAACLALLRPLQPALPQDVDVAVALAEAAWATTGAATAIPQYRRAIAMAPGRARLRARLGLALLTAGQPGPACHELAAATRAEPDAPSLTHLGMALLADGRPQAAITPLLHAAQLDPADSASAFHLGQALRDLNRTDDAVTALAEAVRRAPRQAYLRLALADALAASGNHADARVELRAATVLDPGYALAWARLGDMEQLTGDASATLGCYRTAAALDDGPAVMALLGNALLAAGDPAGQRELGRSMRATWSRPRTRTPSVAILAAPGHANTPTSYIVDRTRFTVSPVFLLDGFDYPDLGQHHDVLFNAVGDPDAAPRALALATVLAATAGLPVLNPPAAITGRERTAERLAGIPCLHVPQTVRCTAAQVGGLAWSGPVLVRPVGSHGGKDLAVSHTPAEAAQAASLAGGEVYVTGYVDYRSGGGLHRKLRIVFVDGQAFPVHLAIGEHWLSHYFRTAMADHPQWRAEEAAFLSSHEAYLGPAICRALAEVPLRTGLGFFGIDAAIGPDGRLVVFECNASMLVRHVDRPAMFDYKRKPAERVRDAMGALLQRMASERR